MQNSILDRVISSKKTSEIEHFNPSEVVTALLKNLLAREEEVLKRRYGLFSTKIETLEEIGASFNVTRERIRQIQNTGIHKIKRNKEFLNLVAPVENAVYTVLEQHGGIMTEESLLTNLLQIVGNNEINRNNLLFLMSELFGNKFKVIKSSPEFRKSWQIIHAQLHVVREVIASLITIIQQKNKPVVFNDILADFKRNEVFQKYQHVLTDDVIHSYLEVSPKISKNPFQEYGFTDWGSVVPKRMNDKIYLVLKRHGKPMHFTEIAKIINETGFDTRKAYPPTVHNELILNERYVLVGRGIYALKEWGYKPGVVIDVLAEILKKENRPLTRKELVEKVLEQRVVKKNTIHLALTDKTRFTKNPDGTYSAAQ